MKALAAGLFLSLAISSQAQDTLGLSNGYKNLSTANFDLSLVQDSQILASIRPKGQEFDFSPSQYLQYRADDGQYHVGDINFRYRGVGNSDWIDASTASSRKAVNETSSTSALSEANLANTLPDSSPLEVTRKWTDVHGDLGLTFTLTNTGNQSVEIGSLGLPLEFNSIFFNYTAEEALAKCSLIDPYIGLGGGYVQVTPTSGTGAALVITPLGDTPFEAWNFLDEPTDGALPYHSQVFEGFYEWQTLTRAHAENEWAGVEPWHEPRSKIIEPESSWTVGLRLSLVKNGVRGIGDVVEATGTPYAVGVPGYIVPADLEASLYLFTNKTVAEMTTTPAEALEISKSNGDNLWKLRPQSGVWGRVRLTVTYSDGVNQTVHYYITDNASQAIGKLGNFFTTKAWFNDSSDPFGRAPSVISYDRIEDKQVKQDPRVWIAGLMDEGGSGAWLATLMKQSIQPESEQIAKLEQFIEHTLWGDIQVRDNHTGPTNTSADIYGVRKSVFFYQQDYVPDYEYDSSIDWGNWWSWNRADSYSVDGRAYNYVHVTAAYWAMYRVARAYPELVSVHDWQWYLNQAYETVMRCYVQDETGYYYVGYALVGLMGETVWGELLNDLKRENHTEKVQKLETVMQDRVDYWASLPAPFGSEQAWDSTGQEGVYYWTRYFGHEALVNKTVNSILGYMPTVAHWGWNGNARRYWDNIYGGKLQRFERQIHHYGSGLNALPLLSHFRHNPQDTYLLHVGYGGMNGPLSSIDEEGFASASFHSWPDTLAWDGYSGDYGPNFLGLALGSAVYLVDDPKLGFVAYGGSLKLSENSSSIIVATRDAVKHRIFVGPLSLFVTIDAGAIEGFEYDSAKGTVSLTLATKSSSAPATAAEVEAAVVWVEDVSGTRAYALDGEYEGEREGWKVAFGNHSEVTVVIRSQ
ncbi:hypothetical protein BDW74DRAFT_185011 [Aspergillus multicolor]|uniref:uncharacterized protein n=1 Tax=Aspergillus multicolor TaxID=41759 RepID=UPI003CCCCC25